MENIRVFLSTLTVDELGAIPGIIKEMRKSKQEADLAKRIVIGLEMYNETNRFGKRIYSMQEVARTAGISTVALTKAFKMSIEQTQNQGDSDDQGL